jgi:hypothetical protein
MVPLPNEESWPVENIRVMDNIINIEKSTIGKVTKLKLFIDGGLRVTLTKRADGRTYLNWQVYGPQYWPEAEQLIIGLARLSVMGNRLSSEEE